MAHASGYRLSRAIMLGVVASSLAMAVPALAQTPTTDENWRTSPFHGAIDGATGKPIPCICQFAGRDFEVGERVCMRGVITRCDLFLNNTTWVPTAEPCTTSSLSRRQVLRALSGPSGLQLSTSLD